MVTPFQQLIKWEIYDSWMPFKVFAIGNQRWVLITFALITGFTSSFVAVFRLLYTLFYVSIVVKSIPNFVLTGKYGAYYEALFGISWNFFFV